MQRFHLRKALPRLALCALAAALVATALPAAAQPATTYRVTVTNLTPGQVLSPPIVVSHSRHVAIWQLGQPASPELSAVAEDADASGFMSLLPTLDAVQDFTIAGAPLPPGASVSLEVEAAFPFNEITVFGMLVTTNDAFFGVRAPELPQRLRTARYFATAYDAGSEVNNEMCASIPGPPCGNVGVRATAGAEGFVHVHNGVHGGASLDPATHDWHNPVALVTVQAAP